VSGVAILFSLGAPIPQHPFISRATFVCTNGGSSSATLSMPSANEHLTHRPPSNPPVIC
jgi:hypothetical protein